MSAVFLTLAIGVSNLCLGYALAVYLGYGPSSLGDTWTALWSGSSARWSPTNQAGAGAQPVDSFLQELMHSSIEDILGEEPEETLEDTLEVELQEESPSQPEEIEVVEIAEIDEKYVETSVLKLNVAMMKSWAGMTDIDGQLHAAQGHSTLKTVRACLDELKKNCKTYLEQQGEAADSFHDRIGELGELSDLGEEIEMINLEQVAQIETTVSNLRHMDFESDLEAANLRLLEEINNLRAASHKLRDTQEAAFLSIARRENRMDKIAPQLHHDPLTRLPNRIGLETTLSDWWQQGRHESSQISAALFDLDAFDGINEQFGLSAGDRLLRHVAQFIRESIGEDDLLGRFAGQRFLLVMPGVGPNAATKNVELIRLSIQKATFLDGQREIRLTVAGGLAEVMPEDTHQALFARLEKALAGAKAAGGDQSYFHDGQTAKPVKAPDFVVGYTEIAI